MTAYTGGCACGAIRYEIAGEPLMALQCQCRDCQRHTGGGHASFLGFPRAAMKLTGTLRFHDVTADSGNSVGRGFCANCGSPVVGRNSGFPDMVAITAGSLDAPGRFQPQMAVYTSRGHAWDRLDPALPSFPKMPPMGPA